MKKSRPKLFTIVYQEWTESERGWGKRPDGYTLHLTKLDCLDYVKQTNEQERKRNPSGAVPECYTFADGPPQPIDVEESVVKHLEKLRDESGALGHWVQYLPKLPAEKEAERKEQLKVQVEKKRIEKLRKTALAKLTAEEKKVLGLEETEPVSSSDPNRGWRTLSS